MESPPVEEDAPDMDIIMGHFEPSEHENFIAINQNYADRSGMYMQREAYSDFVKMYDAASKEGIQLVIKSAARNFDYQKSIWERKWKGETLLEGDIDATTISDPVKRATQILLYSSMPGTSRHHWGTDIDLNSFSNSYFESGEGKAMYNWMTQHAHEYGYCQPYTSKENGRTGYEEEKWHWSYMPISRGLTEDSKLYFDNQLISNFEGSEAAKIIDMKTNYILGINPQCIN